MLKIKPSKKKDGWNSIGKIFWDIGHDYIRNNKNFLDSFLKDIQGEICVIGASTLPLISEIIKRGNRLTVLDFSEEMCNELKNEIKAHNCTIKKFDVINDDPKMFNKKFDFILTDQLINCFCKKEISIFFNTISKLLTQSGEFRAIIKLGLYDIDKQLIKLGNQRNTTSNFYNQIENNIDYSKAVEELRILFPLNSDENIKKFNWYVNRGQEARLDLNDIKSLINLNISNGSLKIIEQCFIPEQNLVHLNLKWHQHTDENELKPFSSEIKAALQKNDAYIQV